jgi:hypothetical protein
MTRPEGGGWRGGAGGGAGFGAGFGVGLTPVSPPHDATVKTVAIARHERPLRRRRHIRLILSQRIAGAITAVSVAGTP